VVANCEGRQCRQEGQAAEELPLRYMHMV
jgi:hypothetical protein